MDEHKEPVPVAPSHQKLQDREKHVQRAQRTLDRVLPLESQRSRPVRTFRLTEDHPLVRERERCPICGRAFEAGQEIVLVPTRIPEQGFENVPANPTHAACYE